MSGSDPDEDEIRRRARDLAARLGGADAGERVAAIEAADELVREYRGSYDELAAALGSCAHDPDPEVSRAAVDVLAGFYRLAAPAGDALADVARQDVDVWDRVEPRSPDPLRHRIAAATLGLARAGDIRALPALLAHLRRHPKLAIGPMVSLAYLPTQATRFIPHLRARLETATRTWGGEHARNNALLAAFSLRLVAPAAPEEAGGAVRQVLDLLAAARAAEDWTVTREAVRALASFGRAGASPDLLDCLRVEQLGVAEHAAHALAAEPRYADEVLAVALDRVGTGAQILEMGGERDLAPESLSRASAALAALRRLGPAAGAAAADRLHGLLASDPRSAPVVAITLWHVAQDRASVLRLLAELWEQDRLDRPVIAGCLTEVIARPDPRSAAIVAPLLRQESGRIRRYGSGSQRILVDDEALLAACRAMERHISAYEVSRM